MTFLEALYGSQYYEIHKQGKDGNKGRFNGNVFLSAFILLFLLVVMMVCVRFLSGFNESLTRSIRSIFGYSTGKSIGKLLAIPAFAVIYLVIAMTVGTKGNFRAKADTFMAYPDEIKKKANKMVLVPFFILLITLLGTALSSL